MSVHIIFSSVWAAEWLPFWKELFTQFSICSLCIVTICNFSYLPFWFLGGNRSLIALVPGYSLLVTFAISSSACHRYSFFILSICIFNDSHFGSGTIHLFIFNYYD